MYEFGRSNWSGGGGDVMNIVPQGAVKAMLLVIDFYWVEW